MRRMLEIARGIFWAVIALLAAGAVALLRTIGEKGGNDDRD